MMNDSKQPSEILNSLSSFHDSETFHELLRDYVWPFLDQLPPDQKANLVKTLESAGTSYRGVGLISYDTHTQSITGDLKALKRHVKDNWRGGYEEQGEMMAEILEELSDWLRDLWTAGVAEGVEHLLVHKSLKFCKASYDALGSTNSRAEFGDMDSPEIVIEDFEDRVIYKVHYGSFEHAMLFVWRDLLISSIVKTQSTGLAEKIVSDMQALGIAAEMMERLDEEVSAPPQIDRPILSMEEENKRDWAAEERRDLLLNAHFTPEMRAAIPQAKEILVAAELSKFEKDPDSNVFISIISARPQLRDRLLAIARARYIPPKDRWTKLGHAFRIFKHCGACEDLLVLLGSDSYDVDDDTRRNTISYLMEHSQDIRLRAKPHLESGLLSAQKKIVSEITYVFPTLSRAWRYLQDAIAAGKITKEASDDSPSGRPQTDRLGVYYDNKIKHRCADPARDPTLKVFRDKAGWADAEESDDESENELCDNIYNDDYDEKADPDLPLEAITALKNWVKILDKWPDINEKNAIKASMRTQTPEDFTTFFDVDGVADILARRCDYGASKPCRQRLGRAIRELYFSFARDGAEKDLIKKDIPEELSFYVV